MGLGPKSATLQSAATTGNGTVLEVGAYTVLALGMIGTAGADRVVNFEGSQDGTNYVGIMGQNKTTLAQAATATIAGTTAQVWTIPLAGLRTFRARVSGGASGSVTVTVTAHEAGTPSWVGV